MEKPTASGEPMLYLAIAAYATAMIVANLLTAKFGPAITPLNAFVLIGLDLALRDWLHVRLERAQMGLLIVATGALTYALNPATGMIAIASVAAFVAASVVDWFVFSRTSGSWIKRSNVSNAAGAVVDSLLFPTIAFGALMPSIVGMQFVAKVVGGAVWSILLFKVMKDEET
jgi:uncharacterized PurR-regulated membrane protein YhhQ (DUF165 family)